MAIKYFRAKQPWEAYYITMDFFRDIDDGARIVSATVKVVDGSGEDKTDTMTDANKQIISGQKVIIWICGGTEDTYKVTCKIETSSGEKYELDAYQEVIEL